MSQVISWPEPRIRNRILGVIGGIAFLVMLYAWALPGDLAVGRDNPDGLAGVYTVNGVDPTGNEYSGTMVITATSVDGRFDVEWIVTAAIQRGVGIRNGDRMVVEWSEVNNATGDGTGATVYEILSSGQLVGTWRAEGFENPGTERVFPEA